MTARIPARSERQAMDWSLVLVSQGIETTIDSDPEAGWGLVVPEPDRERAIRALEQYRRENPRWPWRREIPRQGILFDWGSLGWVLLVSLFFFAEQSRDLSAGVLDAAAVAHGEWWRLFTAIFLHADPGHLLANITLGFLLLGLTMGRYGTGIGLLAAYLAGAGGNCLTLIDQTHRSLGASGMVMGCVGLLAAQSIPIRPRDPHARRYAISGLLAGLILFVLLGLNPDSDVLAHLGGFLSGILLGIILALARRLTRSSAADLFSGTVFCVAVVVSWWLAFRAGG